MRHRAPLRHMLLFYLVLHQKEKIFWKVISIYFLPPRKENWIFLLLDGYKTHEEGAHKRIIWNEKGKIY